MATSFARKSFGDRAAAAVADDEAAVGGPDLADRGDDRGRAAGEGLAQPAARRVGAPLIVAVALLAHRAAFVSRASAMIESRVTPGRMVPPSGGVSIEPSSKTKNTFMPPSSSTHRCSAASRNTTWSQPCRIASAWATRLAA